MPLGCSWGRYRRESDKYRRKRERKREGIAGIRFPEKVEGPGTQRTERISLRHLFHYERKDKRMGIDAD